jgi:hypothetical protein
MDLPFEMVFIILKKLDFDNCKAASLTCKTWYYAFKQILADSNVTLTPHSSIDSGSLDFIRNFKTLKFSSNISFKMLSTSHIYSLENLETLHFENSTMLTLDLLFDILKKTPNLKHLLLIECESLFISNLNEKTEFVTCQSIENLSLRNNRYLNDFAFNILFDMCSNANKLDVSVANFLSLRLSTIGNPASKHSKAFISIENFLFKIKSKSQNIKSLDLSSTNLNDSNLVSLLCDPNDNLLLDELIVENLSKLKQTTLKQILAKQTFLTHLSTSNSFRHYDTGKFDEIFNTVNSNLAFCKNLRVLKIQHAQFNSIDPLADCVEYLVNLAHFDMSSCDFKHTISNQRSNRFASNLTKLSNLEFLALNNCKLLVNDSFVKILSYYLSERSLQHLELRSCQQVTDVAVHYICTYLTKLKYLDLSHCLKLTDYAFNLKADLNSILTSDNSFTYHTSFGFCKCKMCQRSLTTLAKPRVNFQDTAEISDDLDHVTSDADASLNNLKNLKTLKLAALNNLTDIAFADYRGFGCLTTVDFSDCIHMKFNFIRNYSNQACFCLKRALFEKCSAFDDEATLLSLVRNSKFLFELNVSHVPAMTNSILSYVTNSRLKLKYLDVSFCKNLTKTHLDLYENFLFKTDIPFVIKRA